ncbi:hypothetical protein SK066_20035 [Paenibacillus hunanensis]|uniref:hypothetical protein n=1 Tax=Paenibacillus hunanensis TaxID=539262 RepID=UPI002A6B63E1|nr:hypothetical protein [Paenibacillus hunanensis]WPP40842.1 hypothetical protein SK066_20035 [Paenibacillus hunanensis]
MAKSIRSIMRNEKCFNPFSDSFNFEKALNKAESYMKKNSANMKEKETLDNHYALSILENSNHFNDYFQMMYQYMKLMIDNSEGSVESILKYVISFSNHDTCKITRDIKHFIEDNSEFKIEDFASMHIQDEHSLMGSMNAEAMYEVQVDILNLILNYLKYFTNEKDIHNNFNKEVLHENCFKMYRAANIMYVIKEAYDTVLWENGKIDKENEKIYLRHIDENRTILKQVGNLRLIRNELANKMIMTQKAEPILLETLKRQRRGLFISQVDINIRGFIKISVMDGDIPEEIINDFISAYAILVAFYPHLTNEQLEGIGNLTVHDLQALHIELIAVGHILIKKLDETNDYNVRIKRKELINYFLKVTHYSKSQIESYLSLVESDFYGESRINLWEKPLIKVKEVYYFALPALLHPNYLQLIDAWLESARFSLDLRGSALEIFIKSNLKNKLKGKGDFKILEASNFKIDIENSEEIDLLISFDNVIILGEIKNIKFPMEPRDYHNSLKRLEEGAHQVIRKKDFLLKNKNEFLDSLGDIEGKEILCVVITNYTHFTGISIDEVPIIDYMAFQNYMDEGYIINNKSKLEDGEFTTEEIERIYLWKDNVSFFENLKSYLSNPKIIDIVKDNVEMIEQRMTLEEATPEIYFQYAQLISG